MKQILFVSLFILITIFSLLLFCNNTVSNGNRYRPSENDYMHLRKTIVVEKDGIFHYGKAKKQIMNGNIVVFLTGSPYAMGFQHGILLRNEISMGVVNEFANPLSTIEGFMDMPGPVIWCVMKYLEFVLYTPLEKHMPLEYLQELKGIADGAGLEFRTIFIANFLSDMGMVMLKDEYSGKFKAVHSMLSCSDFAVANKATSDGTLLIGRNTDYGGQGRWMKNQTIFIYRPKNGHSYVNIGTAGIIKCNAGMNEKGLTVGGHFMAFEDASPNGVSFAILENMIMRRASNIDEALSIIRSCKIAGSWGLFIADGNTRKAVAVEANSKITAVRFMEHDVLYQTNFALTEEMAKHDLLRKNNMFMRDIAGRYHDLGELIKKYFGRITPENAAEFLGNHHDFVIDAERSYGYSTGAMTTVTSVVFSPEHRTFWVASGREPAWNNEYVGYSLCDELGNDTINQKPQKLSGYRWKNVGNRRALEHYMKAMIAYNNPNERASIVNYLEDAIRDAPDEPIYSYQLAKIYIHKGSYKKAEKLLLHSLSVSEWNNDQAISLLLLGNTYDLLKLRSKAISYYDKVILLHNANGTDFIKGINNLLYARAIDYKMNSFGYERIDEIEISLDLSGGIE